MKKFCESGYSKAVLRLIFYVLLAQQSLRGISANGQNLQFDDNWWMPNGPVTAIEADTINQKLYVAGDFSVVGPRRPWSVHIKPGKGINTAADVANDSIYTCISDGGSGFYIGGKFTKVGDSMRNGIAHIDSNGKVTGFGAGRSLVTGSVYTLFLFERKLYIGGKFTAINGTARKSLGSLDVSTAALSSWKPQCDGEVRCLNAKDDRVYAGGVFSMMDTAIRFNIAAMDTVMGRTFPWNPGTNGLVNAIALYDTMVVFGGSFTAIAYQNSNTLVMFSSKTAKKIPIPNTGFSLVTNIRIFNKTMFICGYSNSNNNIINPKTKSPEKVDLILINLLTLKVEFWMPNDQINGDIYDIAKHKGIYYLCGNFNNSNWNSSGIYRNRFRAVDSATMNLLPFECNLSDNATCMVSSTTGIYMTGGFISAGCVSRGGLVQYDLLTKEVTNWDFRIHGTVHAIKVNQNKLYIGGNFYQINEINKSSIACLDLKTNTFTRFDPKVSNGIIYTIECYQNKVLIGGYSINYVGALPRNNFALVDSSFGYCFVQTMNTNGAINQITQVGNQVYIVGEFYKINGIAKIGIIRCDTSKYIINNNDINRLYYDQISSISLFQKGLYISDKYRGIIYLDTATFKEIKLDSQPNSRTYTTCMVENALIIGGNFTQIGKQSRNSLGSIMTYNHKPGIFNPGLIGTVSKLKYHNGYLYVGGQFNKISDQWQRGFAVYKNQCKTSYDTLIKTACAGFKWYGRTLNQPGFYDTTIYSNLGCTERHFLRLKISGSTDTLRLTGCRKIKYNSHIFTSDKMMNFTFKNYLGCDSNMFVIAKVTEFNNKITFKNDSLWVQDNADSVYWYSCSRDSLVHTSYTKHYFIPGTNQSYYAVLFKTSCTDTSACYNIPTNGIDTNKTVKIQLYPNPAESTLMLDYAGPAMETEICIRDINGREIDRRKILLRQSLDVSSLSSGLYSVELRINNQLQVLMFYKN